MNKVLNIILISLFSLTIISCSSDDDVATTSTTDTTTTDNDTTTTDNDTTGGAATVELSLSGVVTTLAGSTDNGSTNGTGTAASFYEPNLLTSDGTNLYVADYKNSMIRKIVISTGVVTTLAGSTTSGSANGTGTAASFNGPTGVTTDGTNLYVTEDVNHMIRKIVISTGVVTTVAGSTDNGSTNGTGTTASFYKPTGITTDGTNLFVADINNHMIRKIVISTGVVTTLAGSTTSGSANGTGTAASFNNPVAITTDGTNLYIGDLANHMIRKIVISTGVVTTLAGSTTSGSANGTGTAASFNRPVGLTNDGTNLYIGDLANHMIRKIVISTGVVTTLAGSTTSGSANGTGTAASFNYPADIATDGTSLFVSDMSNHMIRKID
jgi:hypothetical protein